MALPVHFELEILPCNMAAFYVIVPILGIYADLKVLGDTTKHKETKIPIAVFLTVLVVSLGSFQNEHRTFFRASTSDP